MTLIKREPSVHQAWHRDRTRAVDGDAVGVAGESRRFGGRTRCVVGQRLTLFGIVDNQERIATKMGVPRLDHTEHRRGRNRRVRKRSPTS